MATITLEETNVELQETLNLHLLPSNWENLKTEEIESTVYELLAAGRIFGKAAEKPARDFIAVIRSALQEISVPAKYQTDFTLVLRYRDKENRDIEKRVPHGKFPIRSTVCVRLNPVPGEKQCEVIGFWSSVAARWRENIVQIGISLEQIGGLILDSLNECLIIVCQWIAKILIKWLRWFAGLKSLRGIIRNLINSIAERVLPAGECTQQIPKETENESYFFDFIAALLETLAKILVRKFEDSKDKIASNMKNMGAKMTEIWNKLKELLSTILQNSDPLVPFLW